MVAGGHAWLPGGMHGCQGGMRGCWGVCMVAGVVCIGYDEIRSMSGRYASYWNAFLFKNNTAKFYFLLERADLCWNFSRLLRDVPDFQRCT